MCHPIGVCEATPKKNKQINIWKTIEKHEPEERDGREEVEEEEREKERRRERV